MLEVDGFIIAMNVNADGYDRIDVLYRETMRHVYKGAADELESDDLCVIQGIPSSEPKVPELPPLPVYDYCYFERFLIAQIRVPNMAMEITDKGITYYE